MTGKNECLPTYNIEPIWMVVLLEVYNVTLILSQNWYNSLYYEFDFHKFIVI
jgi:hypothetical protein